MDFYQKYARTVLISGIAFKEGQCLRVNCEPVHAELASVIEAEAYKMGAKYVEIDLQSPKSSVNRSLHQKEEYLDYVPPYAKNRVEEFVNSQWSLIALSGMEDPLITKLIDQKRNATTVKATRLVTKPMSLAMGDGRCAWCIVAAPTDGWARQLGLKDKVELWNVLTPILRLDHEKPELAWKEHSDTLAKRNKILNDMNIDFLHFEGEGTDLKIYMNEHSIFKGGAMLGDGSSPQIPNLPTEEVFTTPNYRKTEGKVKVTRPVQVLGDQVENAWFVFKNGEVVDYGASYGKHLLDEYFKIDPKAKYLGEVALVDGSSPIFKSGRVFNNILLDENASCHIALGNGIAFAMNITGKSEDELDELGCNKSLLHTDFMIGSETINVTATTKKGEKKPVIKNGLFVL